MNADLAELMWNAPNRTIDEFTWRTIIAGLYDDFESLIGKRFERDSEPLIQSDDKQFTAWIWSKQQESALSTFNWSGVISGCLARNVNSNDILVITADVFLFHGPNHERVVTTDGKHFLHFSYKQTAPAQGEWCYHGWVRDEWKEWEDVAFAVE